MPASTKVLLSEWGRAVFLASAGTAALALLLELWHPGFAAAGIDPAVLALLAVVGLGLEAAARRQPEAGDDRTLGGRMLAFVVAALLCVFAGTVAGSFVQASWIGNLLVAFAAAVTVAAAFFL